MSPSEPDLRVPPEVLAIATALAVAWREAEEAAPAPVPEAPSQWRWAGRRQERPGGYRWS